MNLLGGNLILNDYGLPRRHCHLAVLTPIRYSYALTLPTNP